ncbi:MAG: hypothetical protein AAGI08_03955 [Bacteroidota bacterium]
MRPTPNAPILAGLRYDPCCGGGRLDVRALDPEETTPTFEVGGMPTYPASGRRWRLAWACTFAATTIFETDRLLETLRASTPFDFAPYGTMSVQVVCRQHPAVGPQSASLERAVLQFELATVETYSSPTWMEPAVDPDTGAVTESAAGPSGGGTLTFTMTVT